MALSARDLAESGASAQKIAERLEERFKARKAQREADRARIEAETQAYFDRREDLADLIDENLKG